MIWRHRRGSFDLSRRGVVMAALNVTPDSFSDGGRYFRLDSAERRAVWLETQGADILDVGGESTRPGAEDVSEGEELRRVIPVIEAVRARSRIVISVDTRKAVVAREALRAGADVINDISALRADVEISRVAAESGAGVVLMHMRGTPATMQAQPVYEDAVAEVREFLRQRLEDAIKNGMDPCTLAIDPGIGFGKLPHHNRALVLGLPGLVALGHPVVLGVSHKSFLGWLAEAPTIAERFWPGVALTALGRRLGARVFRVHEPAAHAHALRATESLLDGHD